MDQHNLAAISTVVLHLNNILVHLHQCNPLASSMVALHLQYVLGYDLFQPNPLVINMAALHLHAALELDHRYQPNLLLRHLLATSTAVPHLHSTREHHLPQLAISTIVPHFNPVLQHLHPSNLLVVNTPLANPQPLTLQPLNTPACNRRKLDPRRPRTAPLGL
jgi:hypothetical protein